MTGRVFFLTRQELLQMLDADYVGRQVARDLRHAVWSCVNEKRANGILPCLTFMEQPAQCEAAIAGDGSVCRHVRAARNHPCAGTLGWNGTHCAQ